MATIRRLKDRILLRLSMAPGVDTSVYSEEPLLEMINHKFTILFDEFWWPQFYYVEVIPIDSNGLPTIDLSSKIKRYMDIRYVFPGGSNLPLPRISNRVNPSQIKQPGILPIGDSTKVFQVKGSVSGFNSTVTVAYRKRPDEFDNDTDVVELDDQLMILGTAYDYISDMGINPGQEDKLLTLFNMRYKQVTDQMYGTTEVSLDDSTNTNIPLTWQEAN